MNRNSGARIRMPNWESARDSSSGSANWKRRRSPATAASTLAPRPLSIWPAPISCASWRRSRNRSFRRRTSRSMLPPKRPISSPLPIFSIRVKSPVPPRASISRTIRIGAEICTTTKNSSSSSVTSSETTRTVSTSWRMSSSWPRTNALSTPTCRLPTTRPPPTSGRPVSKAAACSIRSGLRSVPPLSAGGVPSVSAMSLGRSRA